MGMLRKAYPSQVPVTSGGPIAWLTDSGWAGRSALPGELLVMLVDAAGSRPACLSQSGAGRSSRPGLVAPPEDRQLVQVFGAPAGVRASGQSRSRSLRSGRACA
jgi:hypothetical protein